MTINILILCVCVLAYVLISVAVAYFATFRKRSMAIWITIALVVTPIVALIMLLLPISIIERIESFQDRVIILMDDIRFKTHVCSGEILSSRLITLADLCDGKILTPTEAEQEKQIILKELEIYGTTDDYCDFLKYLTPCISRGILSNGDVTRIKSILQSRREPRYDLIYNEMSSKTGQHAPPVHPRSGEH